MATATMSCFDKLKEEIQILKDTFPKTHPVLQIHSASVDELTCHFIDSNGKKHVINATIWENYPSVPPVWFSESENVHITNAIEKLSDDSIDSHIGYQMKFLLKQMCTNFEMAIPTECDTIETDENGDFGDFPSSKENSPEKDKSPKSKSSTETSPIQVEQVRLLEKLRINYNRVENRQGSVQSSTRLLRDLREIYQSPSYKENHYEVEVVKDNLYEWTVKVKKFDEDSHLAKDLQKLKEKEGVDYVTLSILFNSNFPFHPPFVRVVYPIIVGGFVKTGGAICMELLTQDGWSSAYSTEAVIAQITTFISKGQSRIDFTAKRSAYNLDLAMRAYKHIVNIHNKMGWGQYGRKNS